MSLPTRARRVLLHRVSVAGAPEHRFSLRVGNPTQPDFVIVSDGDRTTAVAPRLRKYAEFEAIVSDLLSSPDAVFYYEPRDLDPLLCGSLIRPVLAALDRDSSAVLDMNRLEPRGPEFPDEELPVLTVLGNSRETGQNLTELTFNPETLDITRLSWTRSWRRPVWIPLHYWEGLHPTLRCSFPNKEGFRSPGFVASLS